MDALRVGFFTECYRPIVNGIVASVDALAHGLRERGHEVSLFAPKAPGYEEDDGPTYRMPSLPLPLDTAYRLTIPLVSRRNLKGVIKQLSVIHAHSPFVTGWMGVHYARRFHIPLVYTYHTQLEQYAHYVPFDAATTRRAASSLTRLYANAADAVIVPTASMRDHLLEVGVTARIEVVPSGIDLAHFGSGTRSQTVRAQLGARDSDRLAVCVSRLAPEKNIDLLLQAIAALPDDRTKLALVGAGPARELLELQVQELGIGDRVTFAGEVSREQLPDVYASADVFLFPSLTETQGIVLAESMAAGCPIIAVDTPQARDVLPSDTIFASDDATTLAQAIGTISSPPTLSQKKHLQEASERFGTGLQTDRILSIYADLVNAPATLAH